MTLDACIAHAIHSDLDIMEALPEVHELAVEELEPYIEQYVTKVHQAIHYAIIEEGDLYIRSKDPAGLCSTIQQAGVGLPTRMLLKMCHTIIDLLEVEAKFILDTDDGISLYHMKMDIEVAMVQSESTEFAPRRVATEQDLMEA